MVDENPAESRFGFRNIGIAEVLKTRRYAVPVYQRSYSWSNDQLTLRNQVAEFWQDLLAAKKDNDEYFLGTIVVSREGSGEPDRYAIVDGQQRLATTALLLAAIRDIFRKRGEKERGETVHSGYIAVKDLASNAHVPQLTLNGDDDPFFRSYIVDSNHGISPSRESHESILQAYLLLLENLSSIADDRGPDWIDELVSWVVFLSTRVRVIRVEVPTEAEAFTIFETLNDRGSDLTISDLLKILLFGKAETRIEAVRESWVSTLANLDVANEGGQTFNDFLRTYWSSRYGATRERELYAKVRGAIRSASDAVNLAQELDKASKSYYALLNPSDTYWKSYSPQTAGHLKTLLALNLEQHRPLLLACAINFAPVDFAELARKLISWSIRAMIVGGIGGGVAERQYCVAAGKVWQGDVHTTEEVRDSIASLIHSDTTFKSRFQTAQITRIPVARYILLALERQYMNDPQPELIPNPDASEVNLEHVLPRNPSASDWPSFTDDQIKSYRNRLGNMSLLKASENSRIGNKPFSFKQPILAASSLGLTTIVGSQVDWTPAEIEARQAILNDLAVKAWPN